MTSTTRIDRKRFARILGGQIDVITREQALASGVTESALRYRLRPGGPWQPLLPTVYFTRTGTPSQAQREMGALLYAGSGSIVTGLAALPVHRIRSPLAEVIDVLVPVTCQRQNVAYVRLHRTARMPSESRPFGPVRYALAARAVGDAVRGMRDLRAVRDIVSDAVQRERCALEDLVAELNAGQRRGSRLFREVLSEAIEGSRSVAEADLLALIRKAGLPMPLFNAEIWADGEFVARPDAWYPGLGIAIEVDSTQWHVRAEDHDRDVERQTRMGKHLIIVLRFKPRAIRREPDKVLAAIRDAITRARGRAPLNLRTVPYDRDHEFRRERAAVPA